MRFDDLDAKMRVYETAHDLCVLPGLFIVARIDGRGFTKLTKSRHDFEAPFDARFRDMMHDTTEHLMGCGFHVIYGYTQSDEISLLMHREEESFQRKMRKLNSVLAGEASAFFSLQLGALGAFDCRISQFPNPALVVDYFRWRHEDAHRNALSAHCYWMLRKQGLNARQASRRIEGISISEKNEMLFQEGKINFNDLPAWQRRGTGFYWETYEKAAHNPKTGQDVTTTRRRIKRDQELPLKDAYASMIWSILAEYHDDVTPPTS
ncbi:MAG: guanylyltransferase [Myxococcales bacterium]|nr:guanylyltransferase [Myxococcales bacterium]